MIFINMQLAFMVRFVSLDLQSGLSSFGFPIPLLQHTISEHKRSITGIYNKLHGKTDHPVTLSSNFMLRPRQTFAMLYNRNCLQKVMIGTTSCTARPLPGISIGTGVRMLIFR